MKSKKCFKLNIIFAFILILTAVVYGFEVLYKLNNEMKALQSGAEFFVVYLGCFLLLLYCGVLLVLEVSLYFNARYFLYNLEKMLYTQY